MDDEKILSPLMSLQASNQGLQIIDTLRRKKNWCKSATVWASEADIAQTTLKRFWQQKPIKEENFKAICQAVGVQNWSSLVDYNASSSQLAAAAEIPLYVERPNIESRCFHEVLCPGSLIRIKAPQKMGKTRLMHAILDYAEAHKYQTTVFNLLQVEASDLKNLDTLLKNLCRSTSRRLGIKNRVAECWDFEVSGNDNCTAYLEEQILAQLSTPLVLGLDNVDCIFEHTAIASDFFRLLRSWHEEAKSFDTLKKLRLIVSHSTEVYVPLHVNYSPFNVGLAVELPEFTLPQVLHFAQRHGLDWQEHHAKELMALVGGHPYLIEQTLETLRLKPQHTLTDVITGALTPSSIYRNHLRELWEHLQRDPALAAVMRSIVKVEHAVSLSAEEAFKLHSLGLIQWNLDQVKPRCQLYQQYFRNQLMQSGA